MSLRPSLRLIALCAALLPTALAAQDAPFTAADIDAAAYAGGDLPPGRSALTARVQVLLDRSGTSPGVVDGFKGGMSASAIKAFERRAGLPMDGIMDHAVWAMLQAYADKPVTQDYTITQADAERLVDAIPVDYAEKAQMSHMGYTSVAERLGERFHMDERFLAFLNPGATFTPGETIKVTAPAPPIRGQAANVYIDKATRRVAAYDAQGRMLADYPATVGSDTTPSPSGQVTVRTVAIDPTYTYNPSRNFRQGQNDRVLVVPPGPNGPVGTVWIDLSKPTYGIHGTPTPSRLFNSQSYGCVRLTNWDATELAHLVRPGTVVHFLEPGVTIADAAAGRLTATTASVPRPPVRRGARTAPVVAVAAETAPLPEAAAVPLPADAVPVAEAPTGAAIHEDTTEETADLLSQALDKALPDAEVLPVPAPLPAAEPVAQP